MPTLTVFREVQMENHYELPLCYCPSGKVRKLENAKCWWKLRTQGLACSAAEQRREQSLWKTGRQDFVQLQAKDIRQPRDLAVSLLGVVSHRCMMHVTQEGSPSTVKVQSWRQSEGVQELENREV